MRRTLSMMGAALIATMMPGPAFAEYSSSRNIAGVSLWMSYEQSKDILAKAGYVSAQCKQYGMPIGYSVKRVPSFGQKLQMSMGVKIPREKYRGVSRACFKNTAGSEHISVWYALYHEGEKSYFVNYENTDRLLSRKVFEQRVLAKYGDPNPKPRFATADLFYGSQKAEQVVVWLGKKMIKLENKRISRIADQNLAAAKKGLQEMIDKEGAAKTSF